MEAILAHTSLQYPEVPTIMKSAKKETERNGVGWDGVRNEPLNNASASGTHDHRCRLQLFCFLANYLTSIPFHDPSHSPHLFHRDHLNWTIKILKAPTVGNGQIFCVANLSINQFLISWGYHIYIYI